MTDEEEFAARSQLKWTREGDAWLLLYRDGQSVAWSARTTTQDGDQSKSTAS